MKMANETVDKVRRQEQREHPELKNSRYLWLKNENKLTVKQKEQLVRLKDMNLQTGRAYRLKLAFQDFWKQNAVLADVYLDHWYQWAIRSRIQPMVEFAQSIRRHEAGILQWFIAKVSNGVLEAINSLVQAAKAKARGYRTQKNLIAMVYMIAGKL